MPYTMTIAEAFRIIRDYSGLTMRAFAARIGVSHVHVNDLERGKTMPSVELLDRVREAFGFDPHVLAALKNYPEYVDRYYKLLNREDV